MKKRISRRRFIQVTAGGVASLAVAGKKAHAQRPEAIKVGFTLSGTGPYAIGAGITQLPNHLMWAEEVNKRGGIMVRELGRRLPIQVVQYDDRSDIETAVRLYEKMIVEDKVDLILPSWGTAMHFAIASVANKYGYPLIGTTVTSMKLKELGYPFFFATLQQPDALMKALVDMLKDLKKRGEVNKVGILYVGDLFGIENSGALAPTLPVEGFEVVELKSYPLGVKDLSPVLKSLKAKGVDAFLGITYPPDTILATKQAMEIDFNPKIFYTMVGTAFPFYKDILGAAAEGVMGVGAWNAKVPYKGAKEYFDAHVKRWKKEPDRWGSAFVWASLQILEEAVERAGTLDRKKINEAIATGDFDTIIGRVKFTKGFNLETPGMVGQWQKGEFEVVWPRDRATAEIVFPKPSWR